MKSSGQVREEIIEAATRLFARYGFKKTSIDDVTAAVGIGKGSVYLHFTSKEELFAEVVRRMSDRMMDLLMADVERARSPLGKVRAFVETKQTTIADLGAELHLGEDTILELLPFASVHRRAHDRREHALLAEVLREGTSCGAFSVADPDRLATGLIAYATALETSSVVDRHDAGIAAGADEVMTVFLRGLSRVSPSRAPEHSDAVARGATLDVEES